MSRSSFLSAAVLCAAAFVVTQAHAREIIPAGTILQCTVR